MIQTTKTNLNNKRMEEALREFQAETEKAMINSSMTIKGFAASHINMGFFQKTYTKKKPLFLEFGCGLGRNVLVAAMQGFEAYGIDIRKDLVDKGNCIIQKFKQDGMVDQDIPAKLFYGNILSKDIIQDAKNNLVRLISEDKHQAPETIRESLDQWLSCSLDFVTNQQFVKTMQRRGEYPTYKVQLFELHEYDLKKIGIHKPEFIEKIPFFLENPYENQGLDVYDLIGKRFDNFRSFYSYSWCENLLISEMIRRHHPSPYSWLEYGLQNYSHINKPPHMLFLPLSEPRPDFYVDFCACRDRSKLKKTAQALLECARNSQSYTARIFYLNEAVSFVRGWSKTKKEAINICRDYSKSAKRFNEADDYQRIIDNIKWFD
ncbi:hypothetical protein JW756_04070 [Candidatus Woesearchaeota archaeon]|nr:hypothetical protein [Candidatus Woesearchaeota archaeon]